MSLTMRIAPTLALIVSLIIAGCGASPTTPSNTMASSGTSAPTGITFTSETPAGSTITTIQRGVAYFIDRGSGQLTMTMDIRSPREVPYAALWVYLLTNQNGRDYCGQNLPDAPTWGPFPANQTYTVTISGWQLGIPPCEVTAVRAMLHTRNNGLLT